MSGYGAPPPGGDFYPPPPEKSGQDQQHAQQQQYFSPPPGGPTYPPPQSPPAHSQTQQHYPSPPGSTRQQCPPSSENQQPQQHFPPPGSSPQYQQPVPQQPQVTHQQPLSPPYGAPSPSPQQSDPRASMQQTISLQGGGVAGAAILTTDDVGTFNGGSYRVSHRDTNTILTVQLAIGCPLTAKPGAMIAMSPTITLKGTMKFSLKKALTGGHMSKSHYIGPGELLLAPSAIGDITIIKLNGNDTWTCGKDALLAYTQGIVTDYKSQSLSKAMFSGEGLFVYRVSGQGILWCASFGAIIRKDLQKDEKYMVDNGHLVAWNCEFVMERVASGGIMSNMMAGEGLVCKFTGPGTIFLQTRNPQQFSTWLAANGVAP